jgi:putative ABC transport system substrate-binding protein
LEASGCKHSDPVKDGLVASLGRPGGNITGATFFSNLLSAKRVGLLHQLVPDSKIFATLLNPKNANIELEKRDTQEAARALGLELVVVQASTAKEITGRCGRGAWEGAATSIERRVQAVGRIAHPPS